MSLGFRVEGLGLDIYIYVYTYIRIQGLYRLYIGFI